MATHVLKIRPHFIKNVRNGIKSHEYRLATQERMKIRKGDTLILVSNQDSSDYVRVSVDNATVYKGWDEALDGRWEKDFEGVYSSYGELIKECNRFYTTSQIDQFGIVVFDVRPDDIDYKEKRYLVDTNIIIHRESGDSALPLVGKLYGWIDKMHGTKLYHQLSESEIEKYKDKRVVEVFRSKLNAYEKLIPIANSDAFFEAALQGDKEDENSKNDNRLLLQIYGGRADFLITYDKGILRKADKLYIRPKVLTPEEFIRAMEKLHPSLINYDVLSVQKEKIGLIPIDDPFFDTLREDYNATEFNKWLNGKSGEEAYVFRDNKGILKSFLYLKTEGPDEPFDGFSKKMKKQKWLKVGTFKNDASGLRLGERFLKIIFDNAIKTEVGGIYVTLFEDKRDGVKGLMKLMKRWGFVPYCHNKKGELVMVKDMKNYDMSKDPMFNYPLRHPDCGYFFLPIEPEWHGKLFPDLHLKNEDMSIYDGKACSYAVEKIYVSGAKSVNAKPGDIAFIYRMGDYSPKAYRSVVSGMAILQEIVFPKSEDEFLDTVKNKSVFTTAELKDFYNRDYRTVIKVLFLKAFERKLTLSKLQEWGIVLQGHGVRISTPLSFDQAKQIIEEGERK